MKLNIDKSKFLGILFIVVLAIAIPFTVFQAQQKQTIKQQAAEKDSVSIDTTLLKQNIGLNEELKVNLNIRSSGYKDISGVDTAVSYNTDLLEFSRVELSEGWELIYKKETPNYGARFVLVNPTQREWMASLIVPAEIYLKPKKQGSGNISIENTIVTAKGESKQIGVKIDRDKPTSYTIGSDSITPTSFVTPTPALCQDSDVNASDPFAIKGKVEVFDEKGNKTQSIDDFCITGDTLSEGICKDNKFENVSKDCTCRDAACVTPTPTPPPFSPSVFPDKSKMGTIFQISFKTNVISDSDMEIVFNGPDKYTYSYVLNHQFAKSSPIFSYSFNSDSKPLGHYSVSFKIRGEQIGSVSFEVIDPNNVSLACIPITKNGISDKKLDLVVVSNNFKEAELENFKQDILPGHIDYVFSVDSFSLNKDKFNIWFLNTAHNIDCSLDNAGSCGQVIQNSVSNHCSIYDKILVISNDWGSGWGTYGGVMASSYETSYETGRSVTLHELGHTIGNLADEYDKSNDYRGSSKGHSSPTIFANCDVFACPKWCSGTSSLENPVCGNFNTRQDCELKSYNGVSCYWNSQAEICDYPYEQSGKLNFGESCQQNTACYYGCGGRNGYRSTLDSIMRSKFGGFNNPSKKGIQNEIDKYTK